MKKRLLFFPLFFSTLICYTLFFSLWSSATNTTLRLGTQGEAVRIVFDSAHLLKLETSLDKHKKHLRIHVQNGLVEGVPLTKNPLLKKMDMATFGARGTEISLRSDIPLLIAKQFSIPPSREVKKHRYVIDITPFKAHQIVAPKLLPPETPPPFCEDTKQRVILLDAGHGGQDPGAIGYSGSKEKEITLRFVKILKDTFDGKKDYKVMLTRENDHYIPLHGRVKKGRSCRGDLFLSFHADSHPKRHTRGLSIYTLSKVASDKEAARLAAKENKADLSVGLDLNAETPEVANILIDLIKRETMNLSVSFARQLKRTLQSKVGLLDNAHRFANFAVLRTPDIPAVLVELGYISNPDDEKLLQSEAYLRKIASGVVEAIDAYYHAQ